MNANLEIAKLRRMETKISDIRRAKLTLWLQDHSVPPNERSYFSQLKSGTASFGERAARRLESKYGMGHMYLDTPEEEGGQNIDAKTSDALGASRQKPQMLESREQQFRLQWVSDEEAELLGDYRALDAGEKQYIRDTTKSLPRAIVAPAANKA